MSVNIPQGALSPTLPSVPARAAVPHAEIAAGTTLAGQYELVSPVGRGGMGSVFHAIQLSTGRAVAVKVLHAEIAKDARLAQRFDNEAKSLSRLRHPNTLRMFDAQRTECGRLFIVTELLQGEPLGALLRREGPLPWRRSSQIAREICRSLGEAHPMGIIHRDLKPENIFIDRIGNEDVVKVVDFGIATFAWSDVRVTRTGCTVGTPLYMAPEQARGHSEIASDIYALGVLLYEMLGGRPPFMSDNMAELMCMHQTDAAPPLEPLHSGMIIPTALSKLVGQMLEKAPALRPESVEEVRQRLLRVEAERPSESPTKTELTAATAPSVERQPASTEIYNAGVTAREVQTAEARRAPDPAEVTRPILPMTDASLRSASHRSPWLFAAAITATLLAAWLLVSERSTTSIIAEPMIVRYQPRASGLIRYRVPARPPSPTTPVRRARRTPHKAPTVTYGFDPVPVDID